MPRSVGIGHQNFEQMITNDLFYIDKTSFIKEWWEYGDAVTLITRPRRFGKTLNLSMTEQFFSTEYAGRKDLFQDLTIWKEEKYRNLQGTYPVIFLSFSKVKEINFTNTRRRICRIIKTLYNHYDFLLEGEILNEDEKKTFREISVDMEDDLAADSLNILSDYLSRYYSKKVIILLDEYDTPMQEAYMNGYWDELAVFIRSLFHATFKSNPSLERALMTGITRISKESIFSDLNNLEVVTTTSEKYMDSFGFTQEEVCKALEEYDLTDQKENVKSWYDGFTFGSHTDIYNPWSIASFIYRGGEYDTYWADTSGNGLVNSLIRQGNTAVKSAMEDLLVGRTLTTELNEQIVFSQLDGSTGAVWSLLLATGYLKVVKLERVGERKKKVYTLSLTNMEVASMFEDMVKGWFGGSTETAYNNFIKALLINDVDAMNEFMNKIALHSFSSFDIAKNVSDDDAPERFYHGFVLGLMVELDGRFQITSNRESGFGRYDIMLVPKDRERDCAYIIEFKVHKPLKEKDLAKTVENALNQIEEKLYEAELIADGFAPENIRKYGFAFEGKECLIG